MLFATSEIERKIVREEDSQVTCVLELEGRGYLPTQYFAQHKGRSTENRILVLVGRYHEAG